MSAPTALAALLAELEAFGQQNDATITDRPRRMLNITRDTGEFLAVLVKAMGARRVLEIGTSNGYSTLWLAEAARTIGGAVTTVEQAEYKAGLARANFARAGLAAHITLLHDDAGRVLETSADASFDLVFLDSERPRVPRLVARPEARAAPRRTARRRQRDVTSRADGAVRRDRDGGRRVHHEPRPGRKRRVPRGEGLSAVPFATTRLPAAADVVATDGSDVRVLLATRGGSMAHFTLSPGAHRSRSRTARSTRSGSS